MESALPRGGEMEIPMKQMKSRIRYLILFTFLLAVFMAVNTHADPMLTASANGQQITSRIYLKPGDRLPLTVTCDNVQLVPTDVKYKSSRKAVAKVSKKGVIKAKNAGKTTITVQYQTTLKLKVTVLDPDAETGSSASSAASPSDASSSVPSSTSGMLTCSEGEKISTGKVVEMTLSARARKYDWTWSFEGSCGKDARILSDKSKGSGKLSFTVWPSGGTLTLIGKEPSGLTVSYSFKVKQTAKWKQREQYRTNALAGLTPGMSQKDMIVYFADYIADRAKYGPGQGNFFRVIDEGVGDCWCYSTAFKLLADAVGIETIIVKNSLSTSHYWNQVCLDGVWYNVDAQGYDTGKAHHWILCSDKSHGSRFLGDPNFYSQYSIHYPVSQAHSCTSSLKF